MPAEFLSLETLHNFDYGKASAAVSVALKRAVDDIRDRPGEKTPRKVNLMMLLTPQIQQDGDVTDANVGFEISCNIPKWKTTAKPAGVTQAGGLFFQPSAPDNPDQMTIDDVIDDDAG